MIQQRIELQHKYSNCVPLLYLRPTLPPSARPVNDELTCKVQTLINNTLATGGLSRTLFHRGDAFKGWHECTSCRAKSTNVDYLIAVSPCPVVTNSLAGHYLAWHRAEISEEELAIVRAL